MHMHLEFHRGGEAKLILDDVDITKHVLADGFGFDFDPSTRGAVVSMKLRPSKLTVEGDLKDVPESVRLLVDSALPEGGV